MKIKNPTYMLWKHSFWQTVLHLSLRLNLFVCNFISYLFMTLNESWTCFIIPSVYSAWQCHDHIWVALTTWNICEHNTDNTAVENCCPVFSRFYLFWYPSKVTKILFGIGTYQTLGIIRMSGLLNSKLVFLTHSPPPLKCPIQVEVIPHLSLLKYLNSDTSHQNHHNSEF
jgi:hypothetical protein